ncbi:unnamed protein product [Durusdinium trenchii]|uniref:Uncharacterized protein n=1 Tax=Durusdinium trenchii TaxID=1381693 RepID=A0ABP0M660_9DINO
MWKPSKAKTRNFSDLRLCEMVCACHWGLIGAHSPRAMFSGILNFQANFRGQVLMVSHGKAFQAWKPGPFAVATLVNIALVLAFNPAQPTNEEQPDEHIQCAWLDTLAFYVQMAASLGAACAAAFLFKRAGASQHAMSAVGYALLNWLQSVLMTLMVAAKPWGCRYGLLPTKQDLPGKCHNDQCIILFTLGKVRWDFLSPLNMIFWMRLLAYLAALIWMQWLLQRRIHALEKSSGCQYGGQWVLRLLQLQALCIFFGIMILGPGIALLLMPPTEVVFVMLSIALVLGLVGAAGFMVANLLSSAIAIWALVRLVRDLNQARMLQNTPCDVKERLEEVWRSNRRQTIAVAFSLFLSVGLSPAVLWQLHVTFSSNMKDVEYPAEHLTSVLVGVSVQVLDVLGNALAVILLSGTHRVIESDSMCNCPTSSCCFKRQGEWDRAWKEKVEELSMRGITLNSLLKFYEEDLLLFDGWQYAPGKHRTRDVVRRVIIPVTAGELEPCSYATSSYNRDKAQRAQIMVTHNWDNLFKDLLAAIVANALQECSFQVATRMLMEDVPLLRNILEKNGRLRDVYWVCAFSVNQHVSICHTNKWDKDPISKWLHPTCNCSCSNIEDPDGQHPESEMNKFDDMMRHLASTPGGCKHLIAVDRSMNLFKRAWCIAEIAEAKRLGMRQSLKLVSKEILLQRQPSLENLDISQMHCHNKNDLTIILKKITDYVTITRFNEQLQSLIFDSRTGLLKSWERSDNFERMGEAGRLLRWSLADHGTGQVWRFWTIENSEALLLKQRCFGVFHMLSFACE